MKRRGPAMLVRFTKNPPAAAADTLAHLRAAIREFGAAWRPLRPGQSLERSFPECAEGRES